MIILDASIAIALLDADDTHHVGAVALLSEHLDDAMAMSALTLAEVLVRPVQTGAAARVEEDLRTLGVTGLPLGAADAAALARVRAETRLRMLDVVVVHTAEAAGAAIATADCALADAARARGLTVHDAS